MLIHTWDEGAGDEWRRFAIAQGFGHLVAAGRARDVPVVVPTQFLLGEDDDVVLHLARPNPIWSAIEENDRVLLSLAGDWAFIPSDWKAIDDEDPAWGIPTTYYAAVQLVGTASIVDDAEGIAAILGAQLAGLQPTTEVVDPRRHGPRLRGIRGLRIRVDDVRGKFKYGGNVDEAHRRAVAERLAERDGPGDRAALAHLLDQLALIFHEARGQAPHQDGSWSGELCGQLADQLERARMKDWG
ncbi:MAG: FMN-binding negative transcriptional regulator [Acidimicrobiia bacterium]|nr:FMN-binding negative transcriptional regulator [Acidimicrobiia bacterium]